MNSTYPYTGTSSSCQYQSSQSAGYVTNYNIIASGSEAALQQAVALIGPVSVGIDAGLPSFQLYKSGVYSPAYCSPYNINHAVLVVGYGTTSSNQKYWWIKNSWGTGWGIKGYMMMARDANNTCGVATQASFPLNFVASSVTPNAGPSNSVGSSSGVESSLINSQHTTQLLVVIVVALTSAM